ncbi:hypothetical protein PoMZ_11874 [Pyricularia oryzae]|uniref:Uncharacterized protein n=1 Tax=Pyricularia oryzae TaxID=318829 RepID=A0A4P7NLF6_PYROR|nr:hypothetical protein PoMZ_11874 [Pyricularia oryzae]
MVMMARAVVIPTRTRPACGPLPGDDTGRLGDVTGSIAEAELAQVGLDAVSREGLGRRKVAVDVAGYGGDGLPSVVVAQLVAHLRDARDVVVAAADEGHERLPGVLVQDADASELGRLAAEVGVAVRPVRVHSREGMVEVEVVEEEGFRVVLFFVDLYCCCVFRLDALIPFFPFHLD